MPSLHSLIARDAAAQCLAVSVVATGLQLALRGFQSLGKVLDWVRLGTLDPDRATDLRPNR